MSDVSTTPSRPIESDQRLVAALVYGLFLFSLVTHGFSALVGVVIAYVKRGDARGTVYESHYSNAITVFWVSVFVWFLIVTAAIAGAAGFLASLGPDVWHWHAHDWTAHVHQWQAQVQDHVVPREWWPMVAFLPLIPLLLLIYVVWYLYRVVRGLIHALESRPY